MSADNPATIADLVKMFVVAVVGVVVGWSMFFGARRMCDMRAEAWRRIEERIFGKRAEIDSSSTALDRLPFRILGVVFMAAALYALLVATKQLLHRWTGSTTTPIHALQRTAPRVTVAAIPLVPKLRLGTPLRAKLCFVRVGCLRAGAPPAPPRRHPRRGKCNFPPHCVTKRSLVTRDKNHLF